MQKIYTTGEKLFFWVSLLSMGAWVTKAVLWVIWAQHVIAAAGY